MKYCPRLGLVGGLAVVATLALPLWGEQQKVACTNVLTTSWGRAVTAENAWREYPRPQLVRDGWTSLNGRWDYAVTSVATDEPRRWDGKILVPFPIESRLSGVERKVSPEEQIWYRRVFNWSPEPGTRTILNFERVDFRASVFVNGVEALDVPHEGGNVPFSVDVTDFVRSGENELKVLVWDPTDTHVGGIGKQVLKLRTCFFGPVSGICGGVWLEKVPATYLADYQVKTDVDRRRVTIVPQVRGSLRRAEVKVSVGFKGQTLATKTVPADEAATFELPAPLHLWGCETPQLYDLAIEVIADGRIDRTTGYFGMRKVETKLDARGIRRVAINGKFTYLLATLDQGWWPDGLLTPPSEDACRFDVDFHKQAGFNAIRKHIKIEPRAFYAHCDRIGVMVLQDIPSGSSDEYQKDLAFANKRYGFYRQELKDCVDHLRNHPCIVMWNPFNEGWGQPSADKTRHANKWLKRYDPSRLVNGPSGWNDYEGGTTLGYARWSYADVSDPAVYTDCVDLHHYPNPRMHPANASRVSILGEFGGMGVPLRGHVYSPRPFTYALREVTDPAWRREQASRYAELVRPLPGLARQGLGGSVFTEAQDQFWELCGFITFDREILKFDYAFLRKLHQEIIDAAREAAETPIPPTKGPSIAWEPSSTLDHGEWPRLHVLADGRWALTYSRLASPEQPYYDYALRFSSDRGRTWSPVHTVFRHFKRPNGDKAPFTYMIHNPELTQLPANHPRHPGRLVATANLRTGKGPSSIGFSVSDDAGRTWSTLQRLLPVAGDPGAQVSRRTWEPFVQVLPDGTLLLFYTDVKPEPGKPTERTVSRFVSTDGGDTWKGPEVTLCRPGTWSGIPSSLVWRDWLYVAHEAHPQGHPEWLGRPYLAQTRLDAPWQKTSTKLYEPFTEGTPNGVYRGAPYLVETKNYFVLSAQTSHPRPGENALHATQFAVWALPKRAVGPTGELRGFVPLANPLGSVSPMVWSGLAPLGGDEVMATCQYGASIILVRGCII